MTIGDVAAAVWLAAAAYESVAVWFEKVPTITHLVKRFPRLFRVVLIGSAVVWALFHFEVTR